MSDPCNKNTKPMNKIPYKHLALCAAALAMAALSPVTARAANILVNPGFEANSGNNIPQGWTYFKPPDGGYGSYWIDNAGNRQHSGALYYKEWGIYWDANRTNIAGIYQQFNSAPSSVYQASGWFFTVTGDSMGPNNYAWVEVAFLNSSSNLLALYKSADFSSSMGLDTWFNLQVTNACDISQPQATGDPSFTRYAVTGSVSQLVAPPGTKFVTYRHAFVQGGGWPEGGGACQFDDAVLDQVSGPLPPVITGLFPVNMIFVNPTDGITFTASSPSGTTIDPSGIKLVVNGVDVSAALSISGTASSKLVAYHGIQSNQTYTATINVKDAYDFSVGASTWFQTMWVGVPQVVYVWEAEDFDFTNGMYINNPDLCSVAGNPNCYFGKVGTQGVDENNTVLDGDHTYRPDDRIATTGSGDYARPALAAAGRGDYKVGWFEGGEWVNYTRDWPTGTYWVIARLANGGGSGTLTLSKITATSTNDVGTFTIENGRGWTTYDYVYLKDASGNYANVSLSGTETLRATTGGNVDMGFFMIATAPPGFPTVSSVYPTGTRPFENTNTFSFNVTAVGGTFNNANAIGLILDGVNVGSQLAISGSASSKSVVYSGLALNAMHTATITVTNDAGSGLSITKSFDTFSQNNYIVQAEDFDFSGGQFIDNPAPSAYFTKEGVTNVDFHHTFGSGEKYYYRFDGTSLPNDVCPDFKLQTYIDAFETDYNVGWFQNGDWANYTRTYPAGKFLVYGRFSGGNGNGYTVYLDKVVSGFGTTSQVTQRLGRWGGADQGWNNYTWVPLTDEGLSAPVLLTLGGTNTLRMSTTGNANANYFMLVPISGINVTTTKVGGNIAIAFPTQNGATYRLFYRTSLTSGTWTLLTTVLGDGSVKTVTDPIGAGSRYYQIVAP